MQVRKETDQPLCLGYEIRHKFLGIQVALLTSPLHFKPFPLDDLSVSPLPVLSLPTFCLGDLLTLRPMDP